MKRKPPHRDPRSKTAAVVLGLAASLAAAGCSKSAEGPMAPGEAKTISAKMMADSLHAVMSSDRTVYTRLIVNRLQNEEKLIKASEHWKEDKALVLPAQMFRFGAEMVAEKNLPFSYSLQSLWPVNKQNAPKTDAEKAGLQFIADNKGQNYYTEEDLGGQKYFTAVYPDMAVAPACVSCHNEHKDTPKTDFKIGDVMGGVVIRIPI